MKRTTIVMATAAAALTAGGLAAGQSAGASEAPDGGGQGPGKPASSFAASAGATSVSCNGGHQVSMSSRVVDQPFTFGRAGGVDQTVPGTTIRLRGPRRGADTYLVTFSAESRLTGGTTSNWLGLEAHVDGSPIEPHSNAHPLALTGSPSWDSNSAQFCVRLGPGRHRLQMKTNIVGGDSVRGWLDDYTTSVIRFR